MSSFTSPLILSVDDNGSFVVDEPFVYHVGNYPSTDTITVPAGATTDFASIPWFLHWVLPKTGRYSKAAVLHDYLYRSHARTRKEADHIFNEAMAVLGVAKWKRVMMFSAVRLFGWWPYNEVGFKLSTVFHTLINSFRR